MEVGVGVGVGSKREEVTDGVGGRGLRSRQDVRLWSAYKTEGNTQRSAYLGERIDHWWEWGVCRRGEG